MTARTARERFARFRPPEGSESLETRILVLQVPPSEIGYLCNLVEAYDGIGLVRTLDRARGIIECWVPPDTLATFERLLELVAREFPVQRLEPPNA